MTASASSTKPPAAERRGAPRLVTLREGRLVLPDRMGPEVLIVDLSSTGALIRLRALDKLPLDLVLVDRKTRMAHRSVVARRQELEVGLRFLRSMSLAGAVPAPLEAAKAWCEHG